MKRILASLLVVLAFAGTAQGTPRVTVRIPQCAEDEPYLRGRGDFDGDRWDRYTCVHQDVVERGTGLNKVR